MRFMTVTLLPLLTAASAAVNVFFLEDMSQALTWDNSFKVQPLVTAGAIIFFIYFREIVFTNVRKAGRMPPQWMRIISMAAAPWLLSCFAPLLLWWWIYPTAFKAWICLGVGIFFLDIPTLLLWEIMLWSWHQWNRFCDWIWYRFTG
jgi:hypothetical protein